ncbi:MAG: type III-B CRISPR module-associated protein Cmr3 [Trichocoleus desertorum ATA4-8-CV12]|jgi:CRISPR-associated protein Cmr3|nr:type III-B CRISPR module-associated protein Cmr3 [Trichocoleus desertorum ATA4-8-CV12]
MFQHLIVIEPLGLLYGSSGRFLSPENLVGRSGASFPPSAATVSGLFAAYHAQTTKDSKTLKETLKPLQLAGPFWADSNTPENFHVPTPLHCLVKDQRIRCCMAWQQGQWLTWSDEKRQWETPPNDKFEKGTWVAIADWHKLQHPTTAKEVEVQLAPWKFLPHLHPHLMEDERRVDSDKERGSLFLENGVQMNPDACLIYLSNMPLKEGWYRFGGEGHMVNLRCIEIQADYIISQLLQAPLKQSFALITPAIWGSNRLSYREPGIQRSNGWEPLWNAVLLTERAMPFRYRLGGKERTKLLSRGRYAVPAGTVYITEHPQPAWVDWSEDWFPKEGPSLKRWGCGLALPLPGAIAEPTAETQGAIAS